MLRDKWIENFNKQLKPTLLSFLTRDKGYTETLEAWEQLTADHDFIKHYLYSLEAGGKRLRPMIVQLVVGAIGGAFNFAYKAALSIELDTQLINS